MELAQFTHVFLLFVLQKVCTAHSQVQLQITKAKMFCPALQFYLCSILYSTTFRDILVFGELKVGFNLDIVQIKFPWIKDETTTGEWTQPIAEQRIWNIEDYLKERDVL